MITKTNQTNSITIGPVTNVPAQPALLGVANEILNHVSTLESHLAALTGDLLGEDHAALSQSAAPANLLAMLSDASSRIASMCGNASTVRIRVSGGLG